ncbi:uncharacterized protein BKA78DRAFT_140153 [Phyllosticta capitalensis]|uniref:uncharacterized protein n=1 Tax=Phyllosticta capitalensis TaxID=121624 RepID=UPI00312F7C9A
MCPKALSGDLTDLAIAQPVPPHPGSLTGPRPSSRSAPLPTRHLSCEPLKRAPLRRTSPLPPNFYSFDRPTLSPTAPSHCQSP